MDASRHSAAKEEEDEEEKKDKWNSVIMNWKYRGLIIMKIKVQSTLHKSTRGAGGEVELVETAQMTTQNLVYGTEIIYSYG